MTILPFSSPEDRAAEAYLGLSWTWLEGWSNEYECYLVTIAEIPDYYAAGNDKTEAWAHSRDAFIALIKAYRATGTPIPAPRGNITRKTERLVAFG
jgi:predicted RNase H-like HicB family nuclease